MRYIALATLFIITPVSADMELSIGGLSGWILKEDVVAIKGEPDEKEEFFASMYTEAYHYPGLALYFMGDHLVSIDADSENYCTEQHICPGDHIDQAIAAYGEPDIKVYDAVDYDQYNFYDAMHHGCWYISSVDGQNIEEISIACH